MNLGRMYAAGTGVAQDFHAAGYWFVLAMNGKETSGEKRLEELLLNRKITPKDLADARILAATFTPKPSEPIR